MAQTLVPGPLLDRVARRFRLLGEQARLQILNLLQVHGEMNVQELVSASGFTQANVSKHLGLLAREGLVRRRQEGLFAYYRVDDPSLAGLCLLVCGQIRASEHVSDDDHVETVVKE